MSKIAGNRNYNNNSSNKSKTAGKPFNSPSPLNEDIVGIVGQMNNIV